MKDKTTANLTNFKPSGGLGELFEKAKKNLEKEFKPINDMRAS